MRLHMIPKLVIPFILGWASLLVAGESLGATIYVQAGATVAQIQGAIDNAAPGDTVLLRDGTYEIDSPLTFRSDITFRGDWSGSGWTILDAKAQPAPVVFNHENVFVNNLELFRLHFKNIQIKFLGKNSRTRCTNIRVNYCYFSDLKNVGNAGTPYLQYTYGQDNEITESYFYRDDEFFFGSAVYLYRVHDFNFNNSTIDGYFTKGIDVGGAAEDPENHNHRSKNVVITGCYIRRQPSSYELRDDDAKNEDHAIYVHNFVNVYMTKNEFHGWSATADGGCAKIRNGEGALFEDNNCYGSGVMLYTYKDNVPDYLKNVVIKDNNLFLDPWDGNPDLYKGIGYYRNIQTGTEEAIEIFNNYIPEGCINIYGYGNTVSDAWNNSATIRYPDIRPGGVFHNLVNEPAALIIPGNVNQTGNAYK